MTTESALGKQANTASAKVEGTVFVRNSSERQSFVAGATVKLSAPIRVARDP